MTTIHGRKQKNRKITFRSCQKRHCGIKRAQSAGVNALHFRATALMLDAIRAAMKMQLTREEDTAMTNKYLGIGKFKK